MTLQVTAKELLTWSSRRGAKNAALAEELGCSVSTVGRWKSNPDPWKLAFLLTAAGRCLERRGMGGFQTTLMHFAGDA